VSLRLRDLLYDLEIDSRIRYVPDPSTMLFWYDLRMSGRSGMHVEEGDEVVIFLDFICGDRSGDNLAEDAVLHM
jgi:hypothetical protein